MTVNYEVGDRVRILDKDGIYAGDHLVNGDIYKVITQSDSDGDIRIDDGERDFLITADELCYIEKVLKPCISQFEGYVNIRQVSNLDNGNLLITIECDETINKALIKAERDVFTKKQERKAEIQTEIAQLQRELEELQ